jgi:hypothetical protein
VIRRLFKVATAVSLVLCLAAVIFLIRGHWQIDLFSSRIGPFSLELMSAEGCLHVEATAGVPYTVQSPQFWTVEPVSDFADTNFVVAYHGLHPDFDQLTVHAEADKLGFGYVHGSYDFLKDGERDSGYNLAAPMFGIHAPDWIIAVLLAIAPTRTLLIRRRRRLMQRDGCPNCAYNLTGNTSGVCPECGKAVPVEPEAAG